MSINHKHKFIFVHVPKTAGLSIVDKLGIKSFGHERLSSILKNNTDCGKYLKFAFTRNPWDRAVSAFHYIQKGGMEAPNGHQTLDRVDQKKYFSKPQSFKKFIKSDTFNVVADKQQHFKAMTYYIDMNVDFVGRFENLQEDFNAICDKTGIPRQILSHRNETKHKHYTEYYDDESREIIAETYKDDIANFNYEFQ